MINALRVLGNDTLIFKTFGGRNDSVIINVSSKNSFSQVFIQGLVDSKQASKYVLYEEVILMDDRDTIRMPNPRIDSIGPYFSAHVCHHQRNYQLVFQKLNLDSYKCTLDILTDHRNKTQMTFVVTLFSQTLLNNGNIVYKDRNSNMRLLVNAAQSIVLENLFIDNHPCPRTVMFPK